jgi:hypothetical protein
MRDQELVHRAERAAGALERAWDRWRTMHGLDAEPLPPVSSYVGYSIDEPWGQPRVVFGVGADEAERLAALLDGHDCVGPVHAELTSRPEWRHTSASEPDSADRSINELVSIPAQAPPHAADMIAPDPLANGLPDLNGEVIQPDAPDASAPDASALDAADQTSATAATETAGDAPMSEDGLATADDKRQADEQAESADVEPAAITPAELAPLPPLPDPSPTGPMGSASLAPAKARRNDVKPTAGPGYRGPRYQGSPPKYKANQQPAKPQPMVPRPVEPQSVVPQPVAPQPADSADVAAGSAAAEPASKPARPKPRQAPKADRTRRPASGTSESVESAGEQSASDRAV